MKSLGTRYRRARERNLVSVLAVKVRRLRHGPAVMARHGLAWHGRARLGQFRRSRPDSVR